MSGCRSSICQGVGQAFVELEETFMCENDQASTIVSTATCPAAKPT